MEKGRIGKILGIGLVLVLVLGVFGGIANIAGASSEKISVCIANSLPGSTIGDITITPEAGQHEINQLGEYCMIEIEAFGSLINPGETRTIVFGETISGSIDPYTEVDIHVFSGISGEYGLSLMLIPGATSSVQDPDGGPIASGETACGTIDPNGDTDAYTFYGEAGQGIVVEMAANSSNLGPAVYLYRPSGTLETQVISASYANRVAIREHQLEETGTYTIVSSASWAYSTSTTGEYCLSLMLIPGATSSVQDPDGGPIASGETACGTIDPNGDTDAYTFYGEAGQGIVVEMAANSSNLGPTVYLYRPSGTLETQVIGASYANRVEIREHQLEETGTYTIVSSASWAYSTSTTGEYCLSYVGIYAAGVDISVVLQGGSRPPEGWEVPITIKFFSPGADVMTDTPVYEFHRTTTKSDGTATCQCVGVMPGTYDIAAQASNCPECTEGNCTLTNVKRSVVISAPSTAVDMGTLLAGDANCDGIINISDFGILAVAYMCTAGDPCYDCRADFDCNGVINISDFGLLAVSYMETSPINVSG